jgi:hypothetical protein
MSALPARPEAPGRCDGLVVNFDRETVMKPRRPSRPDLQDWDDRATDALEAARQMPVGPERIAALKKAGVLRNAADTRSMFAPSPGRPPKG